MAYRLADLINYLLKNNNKKVITMPYPTLSLERIVLTHLAASLWGPDDVWEISREAWNGWSKKAENAVIELVSKKTLPPHLQALPTPLQDKITVILRPVGKQLADWVRYHTRFHTEYFALQSLGDLKWSPLGIIDKRAIVECWVQDERLKIDQRYQLACVYCLEPDIRSLWQQMSPTLKPYYFNAQTPKKVNQDPLVQFWIYRIEGAWNLLEDFFKRELFREERVDGKPLPNCSTPEGYAFWRAVRSGNPVATHYFLHQLSPEEKQRHLIPCALEAVNKHDRYRWKYDFRNADYMEVFVNLLRSMTEAEQLEIFRRDIEENGRDVYILRALLEWPWQPYFLETVNRLWEWTPKKVYASLIRSIGLRLTGPNGHLYRSILEAYWANSPLNHRRQYLAKDSYHAGSLIGYLLECRDLKNIQYVLKDATFQEKEAILLSRPGIDACRRLLQAQEWKTLECFTSLCLSSPPAFLKVKEHLNHHLIHTPRMNRELPIWKPFLAILDRMASESYLPTKEIPPERPVAGATKQTNEMCETPPETPPGPRSPLKRQRPADASEEGRSPAKRHHSFSLLSSPRKLEIMQESISRYPSL